MMCPIHRRDRNTVHKLDYIMIVVLQLGKNVN